MTKIIKKKKFTLIFSTLFLKEEKKYLISNAECNKYQNLYRNFNSGIFTHFQNVFAGRIKMFSDTLVFLFA